MIEALRLVTQTSPAMWPFLLAALSVLSIVATLHLVVRLIVAVNSLRRGTNGANGLSRADVKEAVREQQQTEAITELLGLVRTVAKLLERIEELLRDNAGDHATTHHKLDLIKRAGNGQ